MTEDQLTVPRNAITISTDPFNADLMLPDTTWYAFLFCAIPTLTLPTSRDLSNLGQSHIARDKDITLSTADMQFGFMDDGWGFEGDGIGSQDWGGFEAGISFGDDESGAAGGGTDARAADETMSVELGRHAGPVSPRISLDTNLKGAPGDYERDVSVLSKGPDPSRLDFGADGGFGLPGDDFNLGGEDLGISFGEDVPLPVLERERTPGPGHSEGSMCNSSTPLEDIIIDLISFTASPLTTPPQTPPREVQDSLPTPTPKTAVRIAQIAEAHENATAKKKKTKKLQIIDEVTELKDGPGARGRRGLGDFRDPDVSEITTEVSFFLI